MTTYYTNQGGNNTDGLSLANGKTTIAAGIALLSAGDELLINDGTYNAQILGTVPGGSFGAPTIIKAINQNAVILLPTSPTAGFAVVNVDESYITFDGLVVDATNCHDNGGYYVRANIGVLNNITIKNGIARNGIIAASNPSNEPNGILLDAGSGHIVQNMDITNFRGHGVYCPASNCILEDNTIHDWSTQVTISGYGIQVYGASSTPSNNTVRNNRIRNWQFGMILAVGNNNIAHNNLIYANLNDGVRIRYGSNNCKFYSNVVYGNGLISLFIDNTTSNSNIVNNIFYGNGTNVPQDDTGNAAINNNLTGINPFFVNAGSGDFSLQINSPAINVGVNLSAYFTTDFNGVTRIVPWDIGAFESTGSNLDVAGSITFTCSANLNSNKINATGIIIFGSIANINVKEMTAAGHI